MTLTHKDIREKFMIEYDKANVTSSYPSFTEYEINTILDKAYNALIAQKVTGNNIRRSALETDIKSISDLLPLIVRNDLESYLYSDDDNMIQNQCRFHLPEDFLYFVNANLKLSEDKMQPILVVDHNTAKKFFYTTYNIPWIKIPVCYIEENSMCVLYDKYSYENNPQRCELVYIKTPYSFIGSRDDESFECNYTVAEELISLAVSFALENIESPRLNTKLNTRGLEV